MFGLYLLAVYAAAFWILAQPMSGRSREWWVEVHTDLPKRTYYFGPYETKDKAYNNTNGYITDLKKKGSKKISINIKQGQQPSQLTVADR
ncbi:DUF1816 domain-containing protein [Tychonema sp. LEGE 07203]|uniref:DUF1816 domain-containing protein n=1 Tax=Tychonema sp. LEGE 07203 TaxID=1828671 RepID=UPI0018815449|nr:DUF1816 domain-containing protein [Tychonema sp. LEGE 07203]MBE9096597.1 DUF1816 domain-containing protein [Tychonema sp. LEGE 07203]